MVIPQTIRCPKLLHSAVIVFVGVLLSYAPGAMADAGGGVAVTPARMELAMPEDGRIPPIYVYNRSDETLHVSASVVWGSHDINGQLTYDALSDMSSIISIAPQTAAIQPHQKLSLYVEVHDIERSLYPVVFVDVQHPKEAVPGMTRFAVPLMLSTEEPGEVVVEQADVTYDPSEQAYYVHAVVRNVGSTHVRTAGTWTITQAEHTIAEITMPEHVILPGAKRNISAKSPSLSSGTYVMQVVTPLAPSEMLQTQLAVDQHGRVVVTEANYEQLAARRGDRQ